METSVTNKTLEKLKYDLVRAGLVPYETIEQAEEIANAQNINIGQALINSGIITRSEERRVGKECRSRWSPYH